MPQNSHGVDIAITHGAEGSGGPPHGLGDAGEGLRLSLVLDVVHEASGKNEQQNHQGAGDDELLFSLFHNGFQGLERVGVATELENSEETNEAENTGETQVHSDDEWKVERKDGQEIDEGHGREEIADAPFPALPLFVRGAAPDSRQVFNGENDHTKKFEVGEKLTVSCGNGLHGFEDDGRHVEDDERHDEVVESLAHKIVAL